MKLGDIKQSEIIRLIAKDEHVVAARPVGPIPRRYRAFVMLRHALKAYLDSRRER